MLGQKSIYAEGAHGDNFIGAGWLPDIDLTGKITDDYLVFNKEFIPIYLDKNPDAANINFYTYKIHFKLEKK